MNDMVCCSCSWWGVSFTTSIDGVTVDPRILPMNLIRVQLLQLPSPLFRLLDADPPLGSYIDAAQGFTLTSAQLPTFSDLRVIRNAVTAFYRSGYVLYLMCC